MSLDSKLDLLSTQLAEVIINEYNRLQIKVEQPELRSRTLIVCNLLRL